MDTQETMPRVYRELADWYGGRGEPAMRDRFLVLAMDANLRAGHPDEAEKLRQRLLQVNPHHMLRPYTSFAEAVQAADVDAYLRDLRANYPSEVAQVLLRSLVAKPHRHAPEVVPTALPARVNGTHIEPLKLFSDHEPVPAGPKQQALDATPLPRAAPVLLRPEIGQGSQRTNPTPKRDRPVRTSHPAARPPGGWFGIVLFMLVLLIGVAITVYTVARPFVPSVVDAVRK